MWQNLKTQIVMKLKNSNCDKSYDKKTQIVTKLKNWNSVKNSNCEETQPTIKKKRNWWQNLNTQIVTKDKKSIYDQTQIVTKLKMWRIIS